MAAVDSAQHNYVLTWDMLEEGEELNQWVGESFLTEGRTALPEYAYIMTGNYRSRLTKTPTQEEVRKYFNDGEGFQKFLTREDYSYGLADVTNAEYLIRYEPFLREVKMAAHLGSVVELPTVPHAFLRYAPLVDGDWIDRYTLELAEWGACLIERGLTLEEPGDSHPLAWHQITDPKDGSEAEDELLDKLWRQTKVRMTKFPGNTTEIRASRLQDSHVCLTLVLGPVVTVGVGFLPLDVRADSGRDYLGRRVRISLGRIDRHLGPDCPWRPGRSGRSPYGVSCAVRNPYCRRDDGSHCIPIVVPRR